jgi:hypothetical protein
LATVLLFAVVIAIVVVGVVAALAVIARDVALLVSALKVALRTVVTTTARARPNCTKMFQHVVHLVRERSFIGVCCGGRCAGDDCC